MERPSLPLSPRRSSLEDASEKKRFFQDHTFNESTEFPSSLSSCTCERGCYRRRLLQGFMLAIPTIVVCFVMLTGFVVLSGNNNSNQSESLIFSPGNKLIEYETRTFYRSRGEGKSPYQGWPTDESDKLWRGLYYPGLYTYIDADEASLLPNYTERVTEPGLEDKYMVVLDVFHQLHCLNFVRQAFYPERYGRSMYKKDGTLDYCTWLHIDHCIDQVRQSLMCSADVAAVPVQWNDATKSMRPRVDAVHTCRKWDSLLDWTSGRNLSEFHGAARVIDTDDGGVRIEDLLEDKLLGKLKAEKSECNAI